MVKNNLNLLILLLIVQYQLFGQASYNDFNTSDKKYIFQDDFVDNRNSHFLGEAKTVTGKLENGQYYLKNNQNSYWIKFLTYQSDIKFKATKLKIDESKDFEIETNIKVLNSAKPEYPFGLIIGARWKDFNLIDRYYRFSFTPSGYYALQSDYELKWTAIKDWTKSSIVKPYSYNKLTYRKVGSTLYCFLNEQLVATTPYKYFFGDNIGVTFGPYASIYVDYFNIAYLEKQKVNEAPVITIYEPSQERGFKVVKTKVVTVRGKVTDDTGVFEVKANGIEADLSSSGDFTVQVPLAFGENEIEVKATDIRMKSSVRTLTVNRTEEAITTNEKRVALVIGNANYTGQANLGQNPINDARDIAATLKNLNFDVILKTDTDLNSMNNAIREFGRANSDADVALFFFAGHGMQIEKTNYLLPLNVNIRDKRDVSFEAVSVNTIQKIMESSNDDRLNIIVLDACRNNPFRSWERGGESGLANETPPSGTLIAFATSPGATASNGSGANGLYTGELIKQLQKPQRIEDVFINTRVEVEKKSGGRQSPWELARLRGIYYLRK